MAAVARCSYCQAKLCTVKQPSVAGVLLTVAHKFSSTSALPATVVRSFATKHSAAKRSRPQSKLWSDGPGTRRWLHHAPVRLQSPASAAATAKGKGRELPDLSQFPPERIRNISIIAHIDHGKSTLADRLLELTGTIPESRLDKFAEIEKNEQVLDTLKVERERGITVRAQSASMFYEHSDGHQYLINLLDTPGHTDFSSEVLRSLLASHGAILLVDASQGVQAQTLSVLDAAQKRGLKVMGAVNKWDLVQDDERGPVAIQELADLIDCAPEDVLKISAKTGMGVDTVLSAIVDRLPPPPSSDASDGEPFRALVFDNYHDSFRGVVSLIAVASGSISRGDSITSTTTGRDYPVLDVGLLSPKEVSIADHPVPASRSLRRGQVGFVVCSMKDVKDAHLGDTFHHTDKPMPALESFKPPKSSVFCGVYPLEQGGFPNLEESIKRLTLTDRSVSIQRESSSFLGQGFRLGFNGSLHMDVFRQRLEDEYGEEVIVTRPLVPIKLVSKKDGSERIIDNPADFPEPGTKDKAVQVYEPTIRATIVAPDEYTGAIISLCTSHRGVPVSQAYLSSSSVAAGGARVSHVYSLPLSSVITSFHSSLKSVSSGFASFDYEEGEYEASDLVRMNILVNSVKVDALCTVIHRSLVEREGREWTKRLKEAIPRQQFEIIIQAAVGATIVARERIQPVRKDVTAGMYGGDYTRKMKKLVKQREGKKRLKERSIGRVSIPTEAFYTVLGGQEGRRKGQK